MADSSRTNNLIVRVISALIALIVLILPTWFYGVDALKFMCALIVLASCIELNGILLDPNESRVIKTFFVTQIMVVFALTAGSLHFSALGFALVTIIFCSSSLWLQNRFHSIKHLSLFQAKGILGLVYLGLLPGFAVHTLNLQLNYIWFFALLAFVFAGDTFAYLTGMMFGKTLLMPQISPKKTVEGAIGGLGGSLLAAYILTLIEPRLPLGPLLSLAGLAGLAGQMGDLFESLLKRVANRKDSGRLMPGHGGILDRIDGVLFAAPVVLAGALLIESYFL